MPSTAYTCVASCVTLTIYRDLVEHPLVALVSVMDHSPGQRQFAKVEKYREYYMGKYHLSPAEMEDFLQEQIANTRQYRDRQGRGLPRPRHLGGQP